jgi:hypothetical protein
MFDSGDGAFGRNWKKIEFAFSGCRSRFAEFFNGRKFEFEFRVGFAPNFIPADIHSLHFKYKFPQINSVS